MDLTKQDGSVDYVRVLAGIGVLGGIIFSIKNSYGFWKSTMVSLAIGGAGAYAGYCYSKYASKKENDG